MDSAATLPAKTCEMPSTGSEKWLIQDTIRGLEVYPEHVTENTRLVSIAGARAVIEAIEARRDPCVPHVSHSFASQLVGLYPAREVNDATTYLAGITALFSAYPEDFVKRVCDPVTGLPSKSKWLPTIAEIKEALEIEKSKRDKILFNARWTLTEAERRRKAAGENAKFKPGSAEDRAAAVARILRANPVQPIDPEAA